MNGEFGGEANKEGQELWERQILGVANSLNACTFTRGPTPTENLRVGVRVDATRIPASLPSSGFLVGFGPA